MKTSIFSLLLSLLSATSYGQYTEIISTQRPSVSEGTTLMAPGWIQVESGIRWQRYEDRFSISPTYRWDIPEAEVRLGLREGAEIFGTFQNALVGGTNRSYETGIAGVSLGVRTKLYESTNALPSVSLTSKLILPVGTNGFNLDFWVPSFKLVCTHSFGKHALVYNLDAQWVGSIASNNYTFLYGYTINDQLAVFVELFGIRQDGTGPDITSNVDAGITFAPKPDWQLDVSGGMSLVDEYDIFFLSLGYSVRFGKVK